MDAPRSRRSSGLRSLRGAEVALPVTWVGAVAYSEVLVVVTLAVAWVAFVADAVIEVINASSRAGHVHPTNRERGHRNNREVP